MVSYIDTHCHLDGNEFSQDRNEVMQRARQAGCQAIFLPAIDLQSSLDILSLCRQHPQFLYPMAGLHPEEVKDNWQEQLQAIRSLIVSPPTLSDEQNGQEVCNVQHSRVIAIGEVGLDYYWSREYEKEQLKAFEQQVTWSIETRLPLMIHCRKAQNEMVKLLRQYERELPGGVFHCFTGNSIEALELLQFDHFVLGIGGVLTFKKSHLPEVLPATVPLSRIVLETDAPYMAPVPHRGQRNESAYVADIIECLAQAYGVSAEEVANTTTATARSTFPSVDER